MSEINKINAHEWKLRVNFETAVELLYNSEMRVELLSRDKNKVELTINFLLWKHIISIYRVIKKKRNPLSNADFTKLNKFLLYM